ncbi:MAG TPA: OFA family MFS transporter [Oscillospiraceae bacterium]|nr:OFA family MFS transporter [Oscillospiraceae bacterium]HPS35146.1 OFA family MFS transporter [Oscillospiraceae bacterium]
MKTFTVKNRYLVLAFGMVLQLCAGIIYMWSVFKGPVATYLTWDAAAAAITSSIMLAAFVLGIIFGGRLQDKFGPAPVALLGSVLLGLGMILSSFVPASAPWLIYVFYGVIGGFGVGCVYTTTVSVIQKWFFDKRGFATGMMVGAFGLSLVLFAPVTKTLLAGWGVPKTFLAIGITFLVICSVCSLFLANPEVKPQAGSAQSTQKQFTTKEMLKTKEFYLLTLSLFFVLPAYFILNPLFMSLGVERGLTENMAAVGVMITGIASAGGRLFTSWYSDYVGRKAGIMTISILTLAASLGMIVAQNVVFLICLAVIAFCFGGAASVFAATAADLFGTKHIGLNYGLVMIGFGASALIFPIISSKLAATGVFTYSFIVAAVTCAITLVLAAFLKIPKKAKK